MFEHVTPEYMNFIKRYLVNHCYSEYCKKIYSYPAEGFMENLIKYKDDDMIWNEIFNKQHTILNYYMKLMEHFPENQGQSKQTSIYPQETFQEYIDKQINIQTIGAYDYQQFIKSMKIETYKQKVFEKYEKNDKEKVIKNNIVYIIQLYLYERTNTSYYFTDDERREMDISLDILPYLTYLSKNGWYYEDINEEKIEKESMEERSEMNILKMIGNCLF